MRRVLTAEEARALERAAEARGTSTATLMERAGHAVARAAVELAGGSYGRRAVVMCGKGNNGGDGLAAARQLDAWGMAVTVFLVAGDDLREPAAGNLRRLQGSGVRVLRFQPSGVRFGPSPARRELERADVAVDAVLGIGLRGAPGPPYSDAITALNDSFVPIVAADIASGVDSDTADIPGASVRARMTVTFGAPKVGNLLPEGAYHAGRLEVVDIGYPPEQVSGDRPADDWMVSWVQPDDVWVSIPREPDAHKRQAVVLVVAGSRRMTGAPTLVARGAIRAGAGLVTLAVPEGILPVVQGSIAEATFLPLPEGPSGAVTEGGWDRIAEHLQGADAVAIGPGLSLDNGARNLVRRVVRECPVPMVLDADAINAYAGSPEDLADRKAGLILTPHVAELARLLGRPTDDVKADRLGSVRTAAAAVDDAVLLKGWRTLVSDPAGRVSVVATGTPVLATAGTGDVLTGVTAALAARSSLGAWESWISRYPMDDRAVAAAYVHGLAGRMAGERLGEGTSASEVADAVASVIRAIHQEMD